MDATIKFLLEEMGVSGLGWVLLFTVTPGLMIISNRRENRWHKRLENLQDQIISLQKDSITGLEAARTAIVSTQNAVTAFKDLYIATSSTGQSK